MPKPSEDELNRHAVAFARLGEPTIEADNPEWTEQDFAEAKPLSAFPELRRLFPSDASGSEDEASSIAKPRGKAA
jgi:hypothetical protein